MWIGLDMSLHLHKLYGQNDSLDIKFYFGQCQQ